MEEILFYTEGKIESLPDFFSEKKCLKWFDLIAERYKVELGAISFIFCDDEYILDVNRKYLNHDYYTDVITFDYCDGKILNGDVFISLDTVLSNSQEFNTTYNSELHRVICHSLLHLIGYKDKTDEDAPIMRKNEDICLEILKNMADE